MKRRLMMYALLCAVLAALVGLLVFACPHRGGGIASRESAAVWKLRRYLAEQNMFHGAALYGRDVRRVYANPDNGTGFPDLYRIGGPGGDGQELLMIDIDFASATSPDHSEFGYYFVDITGDADGPYDYAKQCGLCAVPAKYGKSGRLTFIVNVTGTIYQKDTGGRPVTIWPDVEQQGWIAVGSE